MTQHQLTEQKLQEVLESWGYGEYAEKLWGMKIRQLSQISNAKESVLTPILAGGKAHITPLHRLHASDIIYKAKIEGEPWEARLGKGGVHTRRRKGEVGGMAG